MLNKERKIMENKLFREKIVKEYVKCKKTEKNSVFLRVLLKLYII